MPALRQILLWLALWIACTALTRAYHPTLLIALTATGCLELASASAIYLNELVLIPRFFSRRGYLSYAIALPPAMLAITLAAVLLIQGVYGLLWHPDPRRFGFWTNVQYDFAWIAIHVVIAAGLVRGWRR